ncbi:MAG: hypothetical protein GY730_06105 [bacterium]|nr:hypothetical protein [bacterium]
MYNTGRIQGIGGKYRKGKGNDNPKKPNKNQGNNDANSSDNRITARVWLKKLAPKEQKEQKSDDNTIQRQKKEPDPVKVMGIENIEITVNPDTHKIVSLAAHNLEFTNKINISDQILGTIRELELETSIATAVEVEGDDNRQNAINAVFLENITDIAKSVNS